MFRDVSHVTCALIYFVVSGGIATSNLNSASHWKLQETREGVIVGPSFDVEELGDEPRLDDTVMAILAEKYDLGDSPEREPVQARVDAATEPAAADVLLCGEPATWTEYDHLTGVVNRDGHPNYPEPSMIVYFSGSPTEKFCLSCLERKLRDKYKKAKNIEDKVLLYTEMGNYWRIRGDTKNSVGCFRNALSLNPANSEVLIYLSRVLFNILHYDDAVFLADEALRHTAMEFSEDFDDWLTYFTIGEMWYAQGNLEQALIYFRNAEKLNPTVDQIQVYISQIENSRSHSNVTLYTALIIFSLILGVLLFLPYAMKLYDEKTHDKNCPAHRHLLRMGKKRA